MKYNEKDLPETSFGETRHWYMSSSPTTDSQATTTITGGNDETKKTITNGHHNEESSSISNSKDGKERNGEGKNDNDEGGKTETNSPFSSPSSSLTSRNSANSSGGPPPSIGNAPTPTNTPSHVSSLSKGRGRGGMAGHLRGPQGEGGRGRGGGRRGGGDKEYSAPRPLHAGMQSTPPAPSFPTRVSSAPPAENVQGYESTHGYYRLAIDKQQFSKRQHQHQPPPPPPPSPRQHQSKSSLTGPAQQPAAGTTTNSSAVAATAKASTPTASSSPNPSSTSGKPNSTPTNTNSNNSNNNGSTTTSMSPHLNHLQPNHKGDDRQAQLHQGHPNPHHHHSSPAAGPPLPRSSNQQSQHHNYHHRVGASPKQQHHQQHQQQQQQHHHVAPPVLPPHMVAPPPTGPMYVAPSSPQIVPVYLTSPPLASQGGKGPPGQVMHHHAPPPHHIHQPASPQHGPVPWPPAESVGHHHPPPHHHLHPPSQASVRRGGSYEAQHAPPPPRGVSTYHTPSAHPAQTIRYLPSTTTVYTTYPPPGPHAHVQPGYYSVPTGPRYAPPPGAGPGRGYMAAPPPPPSPAQTATVVYSPSFQAQPLPPSAQQASMLPKRESKALAIMDRNNKVVKPSGAGAASTSSTPRTSPALGPSPLSSPRVGPVVAPSKVSKPAVSKEASAAVIETQPKVEVEKEQAKKEEIQPPHTEPILPSADKTIVKASPAVKEEKADSEESAMIDKLANLTISSATSKQMEIVQEDTVGEKKKKKKEEEEAKTSASQKLVYSKAELLSLKPAKLAEPVELTEKLGRRPSLTSSTTAPRSLSQASLSSTASTEEGPWMKKSLPPAERKSSESLSSSARSTTPSGSWRRGEQVPKKEMGFHRDFSRRKDVEAYENAGLIRAKNAWCPQRDTTAIEQCEARVRGILNKMTWDTFEKLSTQLCAIELDSKDMLSSIISLVFDKAVDEPNFGEMYAELCVQVSKKSGEWSVIRTGLNLESGKYFWTDDIMVEREIVGPFVSREECIDAATSDVEPVAHARTQKLRLAELVISGDSLIKILESMEEPRQFFTVFRSLSEEDGEGNFRDRIHGDFADEQSAMEDGHRATTFKKLLLKKCQEEFYKENIYDEVVQANTDNLSKQEIAIAQAEEEEARMKAKRRMLGNIRFIGELYKKKMLKEHIMHECILKLLGFEEQKRGEKERKLVKVSQWDEESLEALCKLLTTVGKQLDDVKATPVEGIKGRPPPEHHEKDMVFYYDRLREVSNDKKSGLGTRTRFMIKNLLDLRDDEWVPRRMEAKATKTEEFRRELPLAKSGPSPFQPRAVTSPVLQRQGSGSSDRAGRGADRRQTRPGDRRGSLDRRRPSGGLSSSESSLLDGEGAFQAAEPGAKAGAVRSMPREKVESLVSDLMLEFVGLRDEEEAEATMETIPRELGSEVAANKILGKLCDCKDAERPVLVQLLLLLVKNERILSVHLRSEVLALVEVLEDIVVDVPHVYENLAFALAALFRTKALDFAWFQAQSRRIVQDENAFIQLMVAVFKAIDADRRAPWSWDFVKNGGHVPFQAYKDRITFMNFIAKHQLWATYVEPLSAKIVEEARAGGGTNGILAWVRSLDPSLRNSVPFTRALAYRLLVECPKVARSFWPQPRELRTLFTEISANADARLQIACLHGIQRFVFECANVHERKGMLVNLFEDLVRSGAILPGTLSAWEQDLRDTPDRALAHDVVIDVMGKLGANPVT